MFIAEVIKAPIRTTIYKKTSVLHLQVSFFFFPVVFWAPASLQFFPSSFERSDGFSL